MQESELIVRRIEAGTVIDHIDEGKGLKVLDALGISDVSSSSTQKGESLADTVKIMSIYSDVLVLRHSLDGSSRFAAEVSSKPVIN